MLPPLLTELRNEALQALVLPLVLGIIPQQDEADFMDWTLPSLLPIATSAKVASYQNPLLLGLIESLLLKVHNCTEARVPRGGGLCRRWAGWLAAVWSR